MALSVIILSKNEENNIENCLKSIDHLASEIIIIDDYSTDRTIETIKKLALKNVRVFKRLVNGNFAQQRNYGLKKASGDWILFIDADERVPTALQKEIKHKLASRSNQSGYFLKRKDYFGGRWLRYGETGRLRLLRLAKRGVGEWRGQVHETWVVKGKVGQLENPLLHYPHPTITDFLTEINYYSDLRSQELYSLGARANFWSIVGFPLAKFVQNWLGRSGFLDQSPGLIMALMMGWHSFFVRAKLYLNEKNR